MKNGILKSLKSSLLFSKFFCHQYYWMIFLFHAANKFCFKQSLKNYNLSAPVYGVSRRRDRASLRCAKMGRSGGEGCVKRGRGFPDLTLTSLFFAFTCSFVPFTCFFFWLDTPATQATTKLKLVLQIKKMNINLLHDFSEEIDSSLIIWKKTHSNANNEKNQWHMLAWYRLSHFSDIEFLFKCSTQNVTSSQNTWEMYSWTNKRNATSTSNHILFCILYNHTNKDIATIFQRFLATF